MVLRKLAEGSDYFANAGSFLRVASAVALAPFGVYFATVGLLTPVSVIVFLAVEGDWNLAGFMLSVGLIHGLVAFPLCWFALRLFRGKLAANGVTILPAWFICAFLVLFLTPLSIGMAGLMALQAYHAAAAGNWSLAAIFGTGSCGLLAGFFRAIPIAFRLVLRRS